MQIKKMTLLILPITILLSGCGGTIDNLKSKIADMQTKNLTKKLPDGTLLHFNTNVTPTAAWGCQPVGDVQSYNWSEIQMESQFHMSGPYGYLADKAADYLTSHNLTANYVNMGIPATSSFSFSDSSRETDYSNLTPNGQATLHFYNCKRINPNHQAGMTETSGVGMSIRKGAKDVSDLRS